MIDMNVTFAKPSLLFLGILLGILGVMSNDRPPVSMTRLSKNTGFHRDLTTEVFLPYSIVKEKVSECTLALVETIPSGMFVDVFDISSKEGSGGPQIYTDRHMDTEKPESLSAPQKVYLFEKFTSHNHGLRAKIEIPVLLRYHSPSDDELFAEIVLNNPQVLVKCNKGHDILKEKGVSEKAVCDAHNEDKCDWVNMRYHCNEENLSFLVPVGQQHYAHLVTLGTFIVTTTATVFLLYFWCTSRDSCIPPSIAQQKKNSKKES